MIQKFKNIVLFAGIIFFSAIYIACNGSKNTPEKKETTKDTTTTVEKIPEKVVLRCNDKGLDQNDVPTNEVILLVDGKEQIIDTVKCSCAEITQDKYKDYEIPADAQSACGGWFAGGGDYFYATIQDGKAKVFYGWLDEGQNDQGYHWKEMAIKQ